MKGPSIQEKILHSGKMMTGFVAAELFERYHLSTQLDGGLSRPTYVEVSEPSRSAPNQAIKECTS